MSLDSNPVVSLADVSAATVPDRQQILWDQWKALVKEFGNKRLFHHLLRSPSGWGVYGVDVISTLKATPMGKGAMAILSPLSEVELSALKAVARINARRNEAIWKMSALFYVSVPLTLLLATLQGAPAVVRFFAREAGPVLSVCILGVGISLLFYFINNWRAHQIESLIELAQVEQAAMQGRLINETAA